VLLECVSESVVLARSLGISAVLFDFISRDG